MGNWSAPQRPAAYAEATLVTAILNGTYPPGSNLPGERDLAVELGVTRPTLRETLQRLACEGWLTIRQGKPTRVNDWWREGGLGVLSALVRHGGERPRGLVPQLLEVRMVLAPAYTRSAVSRDPAAVVTYLSGHADVAESAEPYAAFDWKLHQTLTVASGNPVYTLILNGFSGFYEEMACLYFTLPEARHASQVFYSELVAAAHVGDADAVERITRSAMLESMTLWRQANP